MATKKDSAWKVTLDARRGELLKPSEAKKRPITTVTETIRRPKRKRA